jgi:signal transduction histidine kinase
MTGTARPLTGPVPRAAALPLRLEVVRLQTLLPAALWSVEQQARGRALLSIRVAPDTPPVLADPEKLAWAAATVVGNALRYVHWGSRILPGGIIDVAAGPVAGEPARVAVSVEDDGPGIPPERVPWLFTRAPGAPLSVGLALPLVKDVLEAHGGSVEVASRTGGAGHGTTVTLTLPAAERS